MDPNNNAGMPAAVTGLVLGIAGLLGGILVLVICVGWASFEGGLRDALLLGSAWMVLSLASFFLAFAGRKKMRSVGRSGALGMTGMVFGVLDIILSIIILVASYSSSI